MLPFTIQELGKALSDGDVTARSHPTLPLRIYNYTPEIQYTKKWNSVTRTCRGLILNHSGEIVARPWEKFFNLGEVELPIQFDEPVEVMDKADGSLGILYPDETGYSISTRGSFESDQAIHATKLWKEKYGYLTSEPGYTLLFEIVYPSNRIVLDYNGLDDLILLGAVANESGYYLSPTIAKHMFFIEDGQRQYVEWPGPVVETYAYNTISQALGEMGRKNKEGYVIRSHNFMVKVKEPEYLDLHRLVTNISPKSVWEKLRDGFTRTEIISVFPDEFHDYVGSIIDPIVAQFGERYLEIQEKFHDFLDAFVIPGEEFNRSKFAREIRNEPDKRYFFLLLDGRSIRDVLWSELRPKQTD